MCTSSSPRSAGQSPRLAAEHTPSPIGAPDTTDSPGTVDRSRNSTSPSGENARTSISPAEARTMPTAFT